MRSELGIRVNEASTPDLVARRNIAAGEEITFDFYAIRQLLGGALPRPWRVRGGALPGTVTGWKDLPQYRGAAYWGFVASYLLELGRERAHTPPFRPEGRHEDRPRPSSRVQ